MTQHISVDPNDDIQAVLSRLSELEPGEHYLVVPSGARILQNVVDAYLVRDTANERGLQIKLVTNDIMGKIFAERAGMRAVNAVPGERSAMATEAMARVSDIVSNKKRAKTSKRPAAKKTLDPRAASTSRRVATAGRASAANRFFEGYRESSTESSFGNLKGKKRRRWGPSAGVVIGIVFVVAIATAALVFGTVLPRATITVHPVRTPSNFSLDVIVDQSAAAVSVERGLIPGELLVSTQEVSGDFPATGSANVSSKARGTVTIYNEFSENPQTFIPSRFESPDGKIYWTTVSVTVPGRSTSGPGSISAEIVAAEAGEDYNKPSDTRFVMPALRGTERFNGIYAIATGEIGAGKIGESNVVSQGDLDSAKGRLEEQMESKLSGFKDSIPDGLVFWEEAYNEEVVEDSSTRRVGEPAETFSAKLRVTARAIVFKESDLNSLIDGEIASTLPSERTVISSSKSISFLNPPVVDYQAGTVEGSLRVNVDVVDKLNSEAFGSAILSKNKDEIRGLLPTFKGIERIEVKLWPFWVKKVPSNRERVEVIVSGIES